MFTIFRAILIVMTWLKYSVVGGFTRTILSMVAIKSFIALFFGLVLPIVFSFVMLRVSAYVMEYVLDYLDANNDLSSFSVAYELTGVAAYLFDNLGLAQALSLVVTASIIRFVLSMSILRVK